MDRVLGATGALPPPQLLAQLAEALDFVHSKDIVHRDIKPSLPRDGHAARPEPPR